MFSKRNLQDNRHIWKKYTTIPITFENPIAVKFGCFVLLENFRF